MWVSENRPELLDSDQKSSKLRKSMSQIVDMQVNKLNIDSL